MDYPMLVNKHDELTVVYGGQWGSEGKGQIIAAITNEQHGPFFAVRVGGPNAGHTARDFTRRWVKAQQLPVPCFTNPNAIGVIGCSGVILPEVLERELERFDQLRHTEQGAWPKLLIDNQAMVISQEMLSAEESLKKAIGSTGEGVGAATAAKVMRTGQTFLDWLNNRPMRTRLSELVERNCTFADTVTVLNRHGDTPKCFIEGTQGYLLSLNTSRFYPYCTSRDCGPEALMGQVGVSPRSYHAAKIIAVFRTYPIRVGGNSGGLPGEITWDHLRELSGGYVVTPERTTVTNRIRRIATWDTETVQAVCAETRPTGLAITFLDYLFPECAKLQGIDGGLSPRARLWLRKVENLVGAPVEWVSTGPGQEYSLRVRL